MVSLFRGYCVLIIATILINGCASTPLSGPPAGIDLSGVWLLDTGASEEVLIFPERSGRRNSLPNGSQTRNGQGGAPRGDNPRETRTSGPALPSFEPPAGFDRPPVMTATEMTIEQVDDSMGVAYPGEVYRDIDWGKTERLGKKVTAGWVENDLVIHSITQRMKLSETYSLNPSGAILTIKLKVDGNRGKNEFTRVFQKKID